jgi:hypothetical protein
VYGTAGGWKVQVVRHDMVAGPEDLTLGRPVWLELAQGTAEDYVRRFHLSSLSSPDADWRHGQVSPGQSWRLKHEGLPEHPGMTKGEASDLNSCRTQET